MRALVLLAISATLFLAACSGDDDDATADTGSTSTAIDVEKDKGDALKALQNQFDYLTDGQATKAYEEIHPAQRALFTKDQYAKCLAPAAEFNKVKLSLKEAYLEKDMPIPGTTTRQDALALTVEMDIDGQKDTNTLHSLKSGGKWVYVVEDPDEVVKGTC